MSVVISKQAVLVSSSGLLPPSNPDPTATPLVSPDFRLYANNLGGAALKTHTPPHGRFQWEIKKMYLS
jgi:hypothetical protein